MSVVEITGWIWSASIDELDMYVAESESVVSDLAIEFKLFCLYRKYYSIRLLISFQRDEGILVADCKELQQLDRQIY